MNYIEQCINELKDIENKYKNKEVLTLSDLEQTFVGIIYGFNLNGEWYIGQTSRPVKRFKEHIKCTSSTDKKYRSKFYTTLKKYLTNDKKFTYHVLEIVTTNSKKELALQLNRMEIEWIHSKEMVLNTEYGGGVRR